MKTSLYIVLSVFGLCAGTNALAQPYPSLDQCAYAAGTPQDEQLQYAKSHYKETDSFAGFRGLPASTVVCETFDDWEIANENNDCSDTLGLGYHCFGYNDNIGGCSFQCIALNNYLNGATGGAVTQEQHDGTSFSATVVDGAYYTYTYAGSVLDAILPSRDVDQGMDHCQKHICPPGTVPDGDGVDEGPLSSADLVDNDSGQDDTTVGMPEWYISEPYINLWVKDIPVFYTTSLGKNISFRIAYKQRDTRPADASTTVPPTGWSHNWFSYIHFLVPLYLASTDGSEGTPLVGSTGPVTVPSSWGYTTDWSQWDSVVYETDDGQDSFSYKNQTEGRTGMELIPINGNAQNGFRLYHTDGSIDEYSIVSPSQFSFGFANENGTKHDLGVNAPSQFTFAGIACYNNDGTVGGSVSAGTASTGGGSSSSSTISVGGSYVQSDATPAIGSPSGYQAFDALLTKRIDPYGNTITLTYNSQPPYMLQSIMDYDGRITTLSYDSSGMLKTVAMPYGRTASFTYNQGELTSLVDAQGMQSSFSYSTSSFVDTHGPFFRTNLTSIITPYTAPNGTTFTHYESEPVMAIPDPPYFGGAGAVVNPLTTELVYVGWYGGNNQVNKACTVTYPDNSHELYIYRNDSQGLVPTNYPITQIPSSVLTTLGSVDSGVDTENRDVNISTVNHLLSSRNSFHWNRQQYPNLSTTDFTKFTSADYLQATMKHWLELATAETVYPLRQEYNVSDQMSLSRAASPDGLTPGALTWYEHRGQDEFLSTEDYSAVTAAVVLPNGEVRYKETWYGTLGMPATQIAESYTDNTGALNTRNSYVTYNSVPIKDANGNAIFYYSQLSGFTLPDEGGASISYENNNQEMDVTLNDNLGVISYFYNSRHQLTGINHLNGLVTAISYDANNFLSQSVDTQSGATTSFTFANGVLSTSTSPLGLQTRYTWDNLSRLTGINFPDGTTIINNYSKLDVVGHKDRLNHWTYASYDDFDQLASTTDANGNVTTYSFCSCGSLDSVTDPLNNTTTISHDYQGNVTEVAGSDRFARNYIHDIFGRVTGVNDSGGLNLSYVLNNQGLVTSAANLAGTIYSATYDACDRPLSVTDGSGVTITASYDQAGRMSKLANANGTFTKNYTPQGISSSSDALGNQLLYGYDAAGRLNSIKDLANLHHQAFTYNALNEIATLADGNGHVTQWNYDVYGRPISKIDGNGAMAETNGYDVLGRVTVHWTPAGGLTRYTYDNNGNPLTVAYSSGVNIGATYDSLNRLLTLSDPVGATAFAYKNFAAFQGALASEDGPWASDVVGHTFANRVPQGTTLQQPSGSWSLGFGYDKAMRLQTLNSSSGGAFTFTYAYNGAGNQIQSLTMPGGNLIANGYDNAGNLLSTVLKNSGAVLDSYNYTFDANGNRLTLQRTDNSTVAYTYDDVQELTSAVGTEAGGTPRANENLGYTYDGAQNLSQRINNTLTQNFVTDGANQVKNVNRSGNLTVAGSVNSKPTSLTVNGQTATVYGDNTFAVVGGVALANGINTLTTVANGNQSSSALEILPVTVSPSYDANGNLIWDGFKSYQYDCANQLTQITALNQWQTSFVYDGLGRRRIKREASYQASNNTYPVTNEVHYVYDGMAVLQERDVNNNPLVTYTRGLDLSGSMQGAGGIGGLLARTDGTGTTFYHTDGNGNVTMLVNSAGAMQAKYLYDPYGNTLGMWGALAVGNTYRFSSKEVEPKSGIYYYGYRYYEPNLQRWLNRDPMGENGGMNLYGYVGNNPVNGVDPLGLSDIPAGEPGELTPEVIEAADSRTAAEVAQDKLQQQMQQEAENALNSTRQQATDDFYIK